MNPVNATALYVSACRSVLQCDPRDPQSLTELYKILPFFRQSLSCLVCGNLLQDPIAPTNSSCQHYVCKACKGKKMLIKCSWCRDYEQFEENKQLCILVECYRKLCEYIAESPLARDVAIAVTDCPEVSAMLKERPAAAEEKSEESRVSAPASASCSPTPPTPEVDGGACLVASAELRDPLREAKDGPPSANGLNGCNGVGANEPAASTASPENILLPAGVCCGGVTPGSFPDALPAVCEAVASEEELCADSIDICGFGDDVRHSGGPLLLSVEEVLRSLEEDPFGESRQPRLPPEPRAHTPRHPQPAPPPPGISCSAATPRAAQPSRKRSRSESDSEKIQPLPIACIIQGPPAATVAMAATATVKREAGVPAQPVATVPNGGAPKLTKVLLVPSKGIKKSPDHGSKKTYTKAKLAVPKTKDKTKERPPSSSPLPGSPAKVVYKKPQEKKGCKCGRATQNPSVLTCRGQRCPCYSNRKACLDCICRGCQNSYMANGEKKLEAFAVPEKALEQTRLTLGINVTSIAVRNSAASAGVLNVTAGPPVSSLLAASSHEDKGFDENLDMKF